jgi:hypothetical protein
MEIDLDSYLLGYVDRFFCNIRNPLDPVDGPMPGVVRQELLRRGWIKISKKGYLITPQSLNMIHDLCEERDWRTWCG